MQKSTLHALAPSWLINFIGITAGLLLVGFTFVSYHYQGSTLQQQIFETQQKASDAPDTSGSYQTIADNLSENAFIGQLPLLLVWAAVGLGVYYVAMAIAQSFGKVSSFHKSMNYVHASREQMLKEALKTLAVRMGATIALLLFIQLTSSVFLPYVLAAVHSAAGNIASTDALFIVVALLMVYAVTYVGAMLLRIIWQRARIFGD